MNTIERITIYYFSATGNSLKAASDIAARYAHSELVKIDRKKVIEHPESRIVGFVFPVYMGGLPNIIDNFLKNFPFQKGVYYFSVATYYTYKGFALSVANEILSDKGIKLSYGNYIPTIGNCLKEYEVSIEKRPEKLKRAQIITNKIADDIEHKVENRQIKYCRLSEKLHKGLFNLFFKDAYKKFTLEDTCIGCKICEKICPVNNVSFKENKPVWGEDCEVCHACVHWCPKNAINLGKFKGRLQYQNPDIKINNLL